MGIEVYLKMRTTIPKSIRSNVNSICYFALWALSVVLYYNFRVVLVALIPSPVYSGTGDPYHAIDTKNWNFGQIVAITVWAVPVFEYLHLSIRESHTTTHHTVLGF